MVYNIVMYEMLISSYGTTKGNMEFTYTIPQDILTADITSSSKLVFTVLDARKAVDATIKLSQDNIAEFLGMSRMTVRDSLDELHKIGAINSSKDERGRFIYKVEV